MRGSLSDGGYAGKMVSRRRVPLSILASRERERPEVQPRSLTLPARQSRSLTDRRAPITNALARLLTLSLCRQSQTCQIRCLLEIALTLGFLLR